MSERASISESSEESLVRAVRAGDRTAEFELDRRWRPRLVKLARSILRDDALAQDAAQLALWRAFRNLDRYDDSRPFEPWILRIASNCACDLQRRRCVRPEFAGGKLPEDAPDSFSPPAERLAFREESDALRACIEGLSDRNRTVVTLFSIGFSLAEIGNAVQRPKNTVQYWLKNALERLGRCMAGSGFS